MNNLNDILKTANFADKINRQINALGSTAKILQSYDWAKQSSAITMTQALLKGISHNSNLLNSVQEISNLAVERNRIQIPNTVYDAIKSISSQNQQLFQQLNSSIVISSQLWGSAHISNFNKAMTSLSAQIAEAASYHKNWDLIDDFDKISEEAVLINENIIEKEGLSQENFERIEAFFNRIEIKIDKQDKSTSAIFWKILALLSFILTVTSESRNWLSKPELATKQDVVNLMNEQFLKFEKKLKEQKEYRITTRKCKTYLKPKPKTISLSEFEIGFEFVVLNRKHKWIYVSYLNPKDGLPETGWVMKKYTKKLK
jgi:hypothetical protein